MAGLNIRVEYNAAAKQFPQIAKRLPSLTRNSINRLATWAERESMTAVAKATKLPQRFIRNRLTRAGSVKERRATIRRATPSNLNASLQVYMRGLPVYQVALSEQRRPGGGVKAKGGRFYKGAFKPATGRYAGMVFKRMGATRTPLMMPKIGLRQALTSAFNSRVQGNEGRAYFRRDYAEQCRRSLAKFGVRA